MLAEEKELVEFGLRQGIHNSLNWVIVIIVGGFFQMPFWQSLLFYFFYCLVRIYAGGYHAKTRAGCYICSIVGIGLCFMALPMVEVHTVFCILAMVGSAVVVFLLAPMDNPQRRLSEVEKNCFRTKGMWGLRFEIVVFLIAVMIGMPRLYGLIVMAMMFVASMLIASWFQRE